MYSTDQLNTVNITQAYHIYGIPAECHTPEYHIGLNLIRELVK